MNYVLLIIIHHPNSAHWRLTRSWAGDGGRLCLMYFSLWEGAIESQGSVPHWGAFHENRKSFRGDLAAVLQPQEMMEKKGINHPKVLMV